jgi:hypothetical protein
MVPDQLLGDRVRLDDALATSAAIRRTARAISSRAP